MEPPTKTSPPAKKVDLEKVDSVDENKPQDSVMQEKSTPTSDKVCKHLDSQLNEMEK